MAENYDLAAKECYSRLGSGFKCAQEEAAVWSPAAKSAPTPKKTQSPSACELPKSHNARDLHEAEAMEGEDMSFALCTMWEKFKSLIGG